MGYYNTIMLKYIILLCLLISNTTFSAESSYVLGKFKSGTPYIRLKVPESTVQWTCFDESNYEKMLELALNAPVSDSIIKNLNQQIEQLNLNKMDLETSMALEKTNYDNISGSYESYRKESFVNLEKEKLKKWYWGAGGGLLGALLGGLATAILIAR